MSTIPDAHGAIGLPVAVDVSAVHAQSGGVRTYLREVVRRLPDEAIAPVLLGRRDDALDWPGAHALHRVAPSRRPLRLLWEQYGLLRALGRRHVAVKVLHSPHYTLPVRLGRGRDVAQVVTIHDLTVFTHTDRHERAKVALFRRAIRHAARRADAVICVSAHTANALDRCVPVHAAVHVIHHGVDHNLFRPEPRSADEEILRRLGVRRPYLVHVGALEPRKNIEALVRAHQRLVAGASDLQLVLAGAPWRGYDPVAGAGVASPKLLTRTGFVDDDAVAALLRHAAVAAYPSVEEGFGLPAIEALACGAPLVTTAGTVMAELAGAAALTVPPGDDGALAEALLSAIEGHAPPRTLRMEQAARYTWAGSAHAHAEVYRGLSR